MSILAGGWWHETSLIDKPSSGYYWVNKYTNYERASDFAFDSSSIGMSTQTIRMQGMSVRTRPAGGEWSEIYYGLDGTRGNYWTINIVSSIPVTFEFEKSSISFYRTSARLAGLSVRAR